MVLTAVSYGQKFKSQPINEETLFTVGRQKRDQSQIIVTLRCLKHRLAFEVSIELNRDNICTGPQRL